jgi:hypothetical protein
VIPIPGTRKLKVCSPSPRTSSVEWLLISIQYLEENLGAINLKLSDEDLAEVRRVSKEADAAQGARYPPGMMETLYRETPPWK